MARGRVSFSWKGDPASWSFRERKPGRLLRGAVRCCSFGPGTPSPGRVQAVEVDEAFIGGVVRGKPGLGPGKISVLIAAEHLDHNRIGRIRLEPGPADRRIALVKFGQRVLAPGSTIRTDAATQLRRFAKLGYEQEYFTQFGSDIPAHVNMPAVHMAGLSAQARD
ncbi:transposase [Pseudarthrobacter sp. H2]|uniref:transposase n=1 Tax=Pseudarthrobacter sp. H2 TaxID=3418415 RepID=UPI003CFB0FBF